MDDRPFAIRSDCELFSTDLGGKNLFTCSNCRKIVKPKGEGGSDTAAKPHKNTANCFLTKEQVEEKARLQGEAKNRWKKKAKEMKVLLDREGISRNFLSSMLLTQNISSRRSEMPFMIVVR